jgi:hypothetical protein
MFPGSMVPPGVQMAAMEQRREGLENEEALAQRYGHVVRMPGQDQRVLVSLLVLPLRLLRAVLAVSRRHREAAVSRAARVQPQPRRASPTLMTHVARRG